MRSPTLSFCNDIDFASWASYQEVHRCLREEYGLHLEDSFWLFDPLGSELALFGADMTHKGPRHDELLEEIRGGRLSILHSAGNFDKNTGVIPSRSLIGDGLAYLHAHAKVPRIWSNHGDEGNIQNIGWGERTYHQGDDPSSSVYILDLLLQYGCRFFWTDRLTTNRFSSTAPGKRRDPILSWEPTRAGLEIMGFRRYRGDFPKAPDAVTFGKQLSPQHLEELLADQGDAIIYQHWCVHRTPEGTPFTAGAPIFPNETRASLANVARLRNQNQIRVSDLYSLLCEHEQDLVPYSSTAA